MELTYFLEHDNEEKEGIEPENAAPAARPTTNIGENTASINQTFWVNTSTS